MMIIENKYDFGDLVYLITDSDQEARMVTCIKIFKNGEILYTLNKGVESSDHYEYEFSKNKNYAIV